MGIWDLGALHISIFALAFCFFIYYYTHIATSADGNCGRSLLLGFGFSTYCYRYLAGAGVCRAAVAGLLASSLASWVFIYSVMGCIASRF